MLLLLFEGASIAEAREQLSLICGHIPLGRTRAMHRFFDLYEGWLTRQCRDHSAAAFREFVTSGYCPGPCRGRLEPLTIPPVQAGQSVAFRLRAHNDSDTDWHLKPGTGTGVHVTFQVLNAAGWPVQTGFAGLFAARVPPGGHVDLTLAVNNVPAPGAYALHADLRDGRETAFVQLGNDPLTLEFTAR
jgi:hypothetical protein